MIFLHMTYDTFEEAANEQRAAVRRALDEGFALRQASIGYDVDYETKADVWVAFVRGMKVSDSRHDIPRQEMPAPMVSFARS